MSTEPFTTARIRDIVHSVLDHGLQPIVQLGHPVLRTRAVEFDGQLNEAELHSLLEIMRLAMHSAPGVGLAAPQLGIPLRIAVMEDTVTPEPAVAEQRERTPLPYLAAINPRYTPEGNATSSFFEGCLSFAGWQAVVERPRTVRLAYTRPDGTARIQHFTGWQARIIQHETDHLDGTIYIDKANTRSLVSSHEYSQRWSQPGIEHARRSLGF